jgi:hypothetical protein
LDSTNLSPKVNLLLEINCLKSVPSSIEVVDNLIYLYRLTFDYSIIWVVQMDNRQFMDQHAKYGNFPWAIFTVNFLYFYAHCMYYACVYHLSCPWSFRSWYLGLTFQFLWWMSLKL